MARHWQSKELVSHYDRIQSILVERRDEMLAAIIEQLPFAPNQAARIADIGAGFGALTMTVLDQFPNAQIVWVDVSDEMHREATQRLAPYAGSITYHLRDFNTPDWSQGLGEPFDAIVTSLSLHHATDIQRVYGDMYRLLKTGGYFVNGDMVRAPVDWLEARYHRLRATWKVSQIRTHFNKEKTVDEVINIEREMARKTGDHPHPLEAHLQWLHNAGFGVVDCAWKYRYLAVTIAYRTP